MLTGVNINGWKVKAIGMCITAGTTVNYCALSVGMVIGSPSTHIFSTEVVLDLIEYNGFNSFHTFLGLFLFIKTIHKILFLQVSS